MGDTRRLVFDTLSQKAHGPGSLLRVAGVVTVHEYVGVNESGHARGAPHGSSRGPRLGAEGGSLKSAPADKATVHAVPAVKLWFSEPPSEGTVSIRLTDAAGQPVATGDPTPDPEDDKVVGVALPSPLAPGGYTVSWRGMGDDGHVVRGEFAFTVAGH